MHYHNITKDDMKNGAGLRAVLWLSGCNHRCEDCQNPITWNPDDGLLYTEDTEAELFDLLGRDYISGLTLSGGDPLFPDNRDEVTSLCRRVKESYPDKTIWLYTGFDWEQIGSLTIMQYVDVCIDGRYDKTCRDIKLKWRGSANQRVIDVAQTRQANNVILYCD